MTRILITGGLGFIGSHLVDRTISKYEVTVLDDRSSGQLRNISRHLESSRFRVVKGSILDDEPLEDAIQDADAVVHLAAVVSVPLSTEQPHLAHRTNVEGVLKVLESSVKHSIGKVILASSAAVYGNRAVPPLREDFPSRPTALYGATKQAAEAYVNAFGETHGLKTVILRLMNVYGSRMPSGPYAGVMTRFAEASLVSEPLTIYGDGEQTRDFVHVSDVSEAITRALELERVVGETLNVGTGIPSTINKIAALFSELGNVQSSTVHLHARQGEIRASYADITKARELLGYSPQISIENGIESFMDWYKGEREKRVEETITG